MSAKPKEAPRAAILVVEDSSVFREMQELLLGQAGYQVSAHESPQTALEIGEKQHFDLVIIDYELPQMNGHQFMHALRKFQPDIAVIFVSGSLTLELAIQLSGEGVAGIFNKPANPKQLLEKVNETLARTAARDTAARVGSGSPLGGRAGGSGAHSIAVATTEPAADQLAFAPRFLPGSSATFREFTHRMWKVRDFRSVLLLQGETGSPFEPIARDLAEISMFRDGPVMVCTGAEFDSRRLIEVLAPSLLSHDAGTLVVTGVETFSAEQQKMLNNLISGRDIFLPFARRFRLVLAATGRLSERVDDGTFDETLFYKISSLSLAVPSLRDIREDIVAGARHIVALQFGNEGQPPDFAPDAVEWLETQEWPGNYEQLAHTVLAALPNAADGVITSAVLDAAFAASEKSVREGTAPPLRRESSAAGGTQTSTRPPFPISSGLAPEATAQAVRAKTAETMANAKEAAATTVGSAIAAQTAPLANAPASAAVKAPATEILVRPAAPPAPAPVAKSVFRPATKSYDFACRLNECLALAEADTPA